MSFAAELADMHTELFDVFGAPGSILHGTDAAVPVRVVVNSGVQRVGDYGQSIGQVMVVDFLAAEFRPVQGDVLTLLDDAGATVWSKPVASIDADDGFVVKAVMHG